MSLDDALRLFLRLGLDVRSRSSEEFAADYIRLAKRYHPDVGLQPSHELMANINAAKAVVQTSYYRGKTAKASTAGLRQAAHG